MYENRDDPPISRSKFYRRLVIHFEISILVVFISLGIGIIGFIYIEESLWQDALLHSSILLSGLGLAEVPESSLGKIFVSIYGLYADLIFLIVAGIIIAPAIHRLLHKLLVCQGMNISIAT